jgi:NAD(P)-dependent dehydrogenase (short-subunit alcohol dehydrogenase family)
LFKVNVIGNVHLFNLFIPLVLKGRVKKVITISSGLADIEVTSKFDLDHAAPYAISKAAMNAAVAKFSAQYAKNGVLFMSICPGAVNTGHNSSREFPVTTCGDVKSDR